MFGQSQCPNPMDCRRKSQESTSRSFQLSELFLAKFAKETAVTAIVAISDMMGLAAAEARTRSTRMPTSGRRKTG